MFVESIARLGRPSPYDDLILSLVDQDPELADLVHAVIAHESGWNPDPPVRAGDPSYGLMQVTVGTARRYSPGITSTELREPTTNLVFGVRILRDDLATAGGVIPDALAIYNSGAVRKNSAGQYVNSHGIANVQAYVDSVAAYLVWYENHPLEKPRPEPEPEPEPEPAGTPWGMWLLLAVAGLVAFPHLIRRRR
jgi:MYXO-CTERM domain-containing protein